MNYIEHHNNSIQNPEAFWAEQAENIAWYKKPTNILSKDDNGFYRWYKDGILNLSYLAIDKHIEDGYGEQIAIIYDSPVTQQKLKYTFNDLKWEVEHLAGGLRDLGVSKGDTVIVYMP
ncbi:MAG: acetyl-coenzyme A synthetase N-terminal domain-containing protein, partial [Flavobacteriaceae bacterium]